MALSEKEFRELMESYFTRIARFAYTFLHERDAAQDVAQDVFMRLWAARERWSPKVSVRAYLFSAARNRALDVLKHREVEARSAGKDADEVDESMLAADHIIDLPVALNALRKAMSTLPEKRRTALTLRYDANMSHAEIGEALGISAKAAKELIARTLDTLRTSLMGLE